ncbi:class I SAM-dependent methyltransferase [Paraburkholderia phymatum]|uniref:Class I SAM-dependent methyltransferase n=1 Tax=Paraburkholderia phymatum TaxID=148447 RepID=A0ACC6U881_9BURK
MTALPSPIRQRKRIARLCICCQGDRLNRSPAILMPFVANRVFGWEPVEVTADWGFRDIQPGHAYPLCNSVQCADCGALFLDIRFDDEEMAALYTDYRGEAYTDLRDRFEPGYKARNQIYVDGSFYIPQIEAFLERYVRGTPRLLDWGGDTGLNTPFRSRCALHHVYDISGKPVVDGAVRVDKTVIGATGYDLIVFSNVLEHVPHPIDTLAEIAAEMRQDTLLYVEVPHEDLMRANRGSLDINRQRRHWHEHINFFSEASIEPLLNASGLEAVEVAEHAVGAGGRQAHVFSIVCKRR